MTALERQIDEYLGGLGFELVALERGGGRGRPLLRLRIDRAGGTSPEDGAVSVEDCARVSRSLNEWLGEQEEAPRDYRLEVSSPGVERPLVRPRDYERFAGREVLLRGYAPLTGRSRQVQGELLGLEDGEEGEAASVRVADGERVAVPLTAIAKAHLVYRPEEDL